MQDLNWKKAVLYVVTAILGFFLVLAWQKEHRVKTPSATNTQTAAISASTSNKTLIPQSYVPTTTSTQTPSSLSAPSTETANTMPSGSNLVHVKTDVLDVMLDTNGGNLVSAKLIKYPVSIEQPNVPIQILNTDPQQFYIAESGLLSEQQNNQSAPELIHYTVSQSEYQLASGQKKLEVKLQGKTSTGLLVEKDYVFKPGQYAVEIHYQLTNQSKQPWMGSLYQQITRSGFIVKTSLHGRSYTGPSMSSPEKPYEKISFKQLTKNNLSREILGGWIAMQQQYFLSTFIPTQNQTNHFYSHVTVPPNNTHVENNIFTIGFLTPKVTINGGDSSQYQTTFYVGPELPSHLKVLAPNLDRTIDYGWLWFISKFIFWVMQQIHHVLGNWGWSIVIITLLVRLALYWFSARSYRSMAKMRGIQPRIQALKERVGDDRQALTKATMELYRKEKINPMGGCLPMIVQIPVFFALYYVLIESVELRQAPFILWIKDLTAHDPFYVLPILMGLSMLAQQKLSPPPPDPTQAKMMMLLPIFFTVFFLSFPAGLVLYWLTNNCATVAQQWYVMKSYNPKEEQEKERQKKKKKK